MGTLRALDAGLLADAPYPLIGTRGRVAGLARLPALEAARIDVFRPRKSERNKGILS